MEEIGKLFNNFPLVHLLSSRLKVSVGFIIIVYLFLAILLSLINITGNLIVLITGTIYPGYMSLNSIYSKEIDEDKQWLTYWVLFCGINFIDYILGPLTYSIPFYYTLKLLFVIFLFWPNTRGSFLIYENFLFPRFLYKAVDEYSSTSSHDSKLKSSKED